MSKNLLFDVSKMKNVADLLVAQIRFHAIFRIFSNFKFISQKFNFLFSISKLIVEFFRNSPYHNEKFDLSKLNF